MQLTDESPKTRAQEEGEASVDSFRKELGPFVVAAEKTRMPMVFLDKEPGRPVIFANDAFLILTGYEREEALAKDFQSLLAEGADADTMLVVEKAFRGECDYDPELHYKRRDGTEFWASMFVSPVCDKGGTVIQHFVSFIDLTSHRNDNARCKMLIDELNHRVKNTLATVQSIVSQTLRRTAEPASIREAIESRIFALSRSHDLLTSANWEGAGLRDLVKTALKPFEAVSGGAERFVIAGENVHLSPKITLALAIAINELATNSAKYGALSNDAGRVELSWAMVPHVEGKRLVFRWQERGGPPVSPPTHKGFGSWVLERGLAHELGCEVTLEYLPDGLLCTIDLPAPIGN